MNNKDIIKELGKLREVKPAKVFLDENRNELLTLLEKNDVKNSNVVAIAKDRKMWYDLREKFLYKLLKPAGILFLALSVITGGGVGMSFASQNTIPGDIFYSVKLTIEKAQVSLKTKEEDKVKLEVEFAGRRLEELSKVKANEIEGNKKEPQKTKIVLDNFKKNIETVKDRLDKMKEKEFTKETGDVVDMVEKKTLEYSKTLETIGVKAVEGKKEIEGIMNNKLGIKNGEEGGEVKILKDVEEGIEGGDGKESDVEGEEEIKNSESGIKNGEELEIKNEGVKEGTEGENKDGQTVAETDEENEFKKVVNEALSVSEEVNNKAFGIIIEKQQSGEIVMSQEEVVQKIKNKADDVKIKVESLKDQAGIIKIQEKDSGIEKKDSMIGETVESEKFIKSKVHKVEGREKDDENESDIIASSTSSNIGDSSLNLEISTSTASIVAGNNIANVLPASQITNMGDKLTEVDNLLKNGEIANAFEKVKEIKEMAKDVEKKLEAAKVNSEDKSKVIKIDTGVIATSTAAATATKK